MRWKFHVSQCLAKKSQFCTVWRHLNGPHWSPRSAPLAKDEDIFLCNSQYHWHFLSAWFRRFFNFFLSTYLQKQGPVVEIHPIHCPHAKTCYIMPSPYAIFVQISFQNPNMATFPHTLTHTHLLTKNATLTQHHGAGCVLFPHIVINFTMLNPHTKISKLRGLLEVGTALPVKVTIWVGPITSKYVKAELNNSECIGSHDAKASDFAIAWMPLPLSNNK